MRIGMPSLDLSSSSASSVRPRAIPSFRWTARKGRLQRRTQPFMEARDATVGQRDRAHHHRLPFSLRHRAPWNKIEHRLFSSISINWRAKPLTSLETIIELISHTPSNAGLTLTAVKDTIPIPPASKSPMTNSKRFISSATLFMASGSIPSCHKMLSLVVMLFKWKSQVSL